MEKHYRLDNILKTKDLDGNMPDIFIITGSKGGGKSFAVKEYLINEFLNKSKKFICLVRKKDELNSYIPAFWADVKNKFPNTDLYSISSGSGKFAEVFIKTEAFEISCGYVIALSMVDKVKRISTFFNDADNIFLDEFQSETGDYCADEITKFFAINDAVGRGFEQLTRKLTYFLVSNMVSLLNPYFVALGIHKRWQSGIHFMRGHGWVMEVYRNKYVAEEKQQSGFYRAFSDASYFNYSIDNIFLLDNVQFIAKQNLAGARYLMTIKHNGIFYGLWMLQNGRYYISLKADRNFHRLFAISTKDHDENTCLTGVISAQVSMCRKQFNAGNFRFESQECKNIGMDFLGIRA